MKSKRNKIKLKQQQGHRQREQRQHHQHNHYHHHHHNHHNHLNHHNHHNHHNHQQKQHQDQRRRETAGSVSFQQNQTLTTFVRRKRKGLTLHQEVEKETKPDIPHKSVVTTKTNGFYSHYWRKRLTLQRQHYSYRSTIVLLCQLMVLTLVLELPALSAGDWLMDCGECHCKWNSGKKTADCKNLTLSSVPENLSNEVQVLDLSLNRIIYLEENAFLTADLTNLHKLYIRNSTLQHIDSRTFTQLEILIELDLSNNMLRMLQPNVFARLVKVRAVILNGNLLESLGDGIFQNLKYLHKIELKDNRLVKMANQVFVNVPMLSQIYLNNNRFGFLRKESFENVKRLTALSLDGNPWNCTCELQMFRDFVLRRNLYTPPTSCYYPNQLRGMLWIEDQPEAFACKPRIIFPAKGASISTTKENVTLVCRVHASANTHIAWDYNKQVYRSGTSSGQPPIPQQQQQRVHIQLIQNENSKEKEFGRNVFESRLTILGAEKSDEGTFTCIAENAGGKDSVQMNLLVQKQNARDMLFHGNMAGVISLMALGLLSVSVFLAMVTCCIYKRFITSAAAHQHRHHHLDLSGNDPLTAHGTVVANHGTSTLAGNTDVMLGVVNGIEKDISKYKKHQQTTINGGSNLIKDKYTELLKHNGSNVGDGGGGVGGGGGSGSGGSGGLGGHGDGMGTGNSPLMDGIDSGNGGGGGGGGMESKINCDVQLGQLEKKYFEHSNEDMLTLKYPHGRVIAEVNAIATATTGLNAGAVGEFQPDLLPTYAGSKNQNNNQQQQQLQQQQQQQDRQHGDIQYSPVVTPATNTTTTSKTINPMMMEDHHHVAFGNTSTLPANKNSISSSGINRSTYNASAQEYLQARFGSTVNKKQTTNSQEKLSTGTSSLNLARTSPISETYNAIYATASRQTKSLFMPQRTVCSATTTATPTDATSSYEYRQPPPPPYNATHRTTSNLLLTRHTSFNHYDNNEDNNKNSNTKDQGYREGGMTLYETARQTIVTASPSMSFPTTITGFNTNTATISPRRQLL